MTGKITVDTIWNIGETGDINISFETFKIKMKGLFLRFFDLIVYNSQIIGNSRRPLKIRDWSTKL